LLPSSGRAGAADCHISGDRGSVEEYGTAAAARLWRFLMHWTFFFNFLLSFAPLPSSSSSSPGNLMIYYRYKWLKPLLMIISQDTLLLQVEMHQFMASGAVILGVKVTGPHSLVVIH
jgi:hypothetical protein